jgi:NAD(P)-dependent dehydrogenase (short-subunit alcohol dehydrogenase family)
MKFKDKVVIVTGAGRGIGRAIAVAYAAEGASVVIAEKDQVTGAEAEKTITSAGGTVCFIKTDITLPEDIASACLFLTSEESGFITGANIIIDGGMTRKMIYEP